MWILFRVLILIFGVFYRMFSVLVTGAKFIEYPQYSGPSGALSIAVKNKGKSGSARQSAKVYVKVASNIFFRLAPENAWLRWYKKAGFGQEVQVGVPEFDDAFYIAAENRGVVNKLRTDPTLRSALMRLRTAGARRFVSDGSGNLILKFQGSRVDELGALLGDIAILRGAMESIARVPFKSEPYVRWLIAFEAIGYGLAAYALASYVSLFADSGQVHLDLSDLLVKGLVTSGMMIALWFVLVTLFFQRSSLGPLILHDFTLPWCLVALVAGFQLVSDLNRTLDKSSPKVSSANVDQKYTKTSWSRRRHRNRRYYLRLSFESNPENIPVSLSVTRSDYNAVHEGERIEFSVRKGFFGSPYIYSQRSYPDPDYATRVKRDPEACLDMARARKLAIWNQTAESSVNQDGNIEWAEEKYASGKLRQREPVVAGRRHGMATYWFENGRVYGEIPWLNGEKHGSFNLYREDGSLEQSLSYRNGKPHGLLTWYDPQGNVKARALYDNGQVLSTDRKVLDALR